MAAGAEPVPTLELPSGRPATHQQHCDQRRAATWWPLIQRRRAGIHRPTLRHPLNGRASTPTPVNLTMPFPPPNSARQKPERSCPWSLMSTTSFFRCWSAFA
jgi:hypothetical protein